MNCEEIRHLLLDLDLTPDQRQQVAAALRHAERCEACRASLGESDQIRAALHLVEAPPTPTGGWEAFEQRLTGAIDQQIERRGAYGWPLRWLPLGSAVAASLLLGLIGFSLGRGASGGPAGPIAATGQPPADVELTQEEVRQHVLAFDQVADVFDRRTSWVLLGGEASDLGLSDQPVAAERDVLLLRLTMMRGGDIASSADLVIVPGQSANLTVPLDAGQSLRYTIGTSRDLPTRLSIWAELQTPRGDETLAALATQLQIEPQQRLSAGQFTTAAGQYELKIAFSRAPLPEGGRS